MKPIDEQHIAEPSPAGDAPHHLAGDQIAGVLEWSRAGTGRYLAPRALSDTATFNQHPAGLGNSAASLASLQRTHGGG
ncbi:hypothetical protein [Streptomyces subrutilus]|nr:hypothetical protein [Streptomyces subrutilus]